MITFNSRFVFPFLDLSNEGNLSRMKESKQRIFDNRIELVDKGSMSLETLMEHSIADIEEEAKNNFYGAPRWEIKLREDYRSILK